VIAALLLAAALTEPPKDRWIGVDKVKHFFVSAFVHSVAYSAARAAKLSASNAQAAAGVVTGVVGVGREIHDKRVGKPFSFKDLTWDAAGAAAAATVLNKTR
jgi:putative lipoprotein